MTAGSDSPTPHRSVDRWYPAPAKLNLFLHVVGRRPDGYHELQTVFRLIDHADLLQIEPTEDGRILRTADVAGVPVHDDIGLRAARLLQMRTGCRYGARIRVDKRIPVGGGLGGGSSDAATVLLVLNELWQLRVPCSELARWAQKK